MGRLNLWGISSTGNRKPDFNILRTRKYKGSVKKEITEVNQQEELVQLISGGVEGSTTPKALTRREYKQKEKALFETVGIAEADLLEKEKAYTRFQTSWISVWSFVPLSPAEHYITPGVPLPFTKKKFSLWEVNAQYTYLYDRVKIGTFYTSLWFKHYQNNSANADLLTSVDYNIYVAFPQNANMLNYAEIENSKAYIGDFKEFKTTMLNLQLVYLFPAAKWPFKPGVSLRYEKNWGRLQCKKPTLWNTGNYTGKRETYKH